MAFLKHMYRGAQTALVAVFVLSGVVFPAQTANAVTAEINYQGKLLDATSAPVADGVYSMTFSLYTVPTGGSAIWTESGSTTIQNGLFSVMLGATTSLSGVDFSQDLYLGINVEGDGEMSPRKELGTVPAAFQANNANAVGGVASSSFLRSDEADTLAASTASTLLTITQSGAGDIFNVFDGASEVFTILDGGNVGIGDSSPAYLLTVGNGDLFGVNSSGLIATQSVASSSLAISNWQNGYILQASTTATNGFDWVATSTLGISGGSSLTVGSDNQIPYSNAGGTDLEYSADFTYDGTELTLAGGGIIANEPTDPQIVGGVDTFNAFGVTVTGRYAYIADGADGIDIIDVSDPTSPTIVGSLDYGENPFRITIAGRYAYLADQNGIEIIDVSDPTSPTSVGEIETDGLAFDVTVAGRYAYVADFANGLEIIDVSDPTNPTIVGGVDTDGSALGITVAGRYAYVADRFNGLEIIDVSDPTNPTIVGGVDTAGAAEGVAVVGRYAYVADDTNGLEIIDVSDPTSPTIVGGVNTAGAANNITVAGRYAYVADDTNGLEIIDISDPTSPTIVGGVNTDGAAYSVVVAGRYAYVADDSNGLEIIDIGGSEFSSLFAGALGATQANFDQDLIVGQNALINSNLNVGNDARIGGNVAIQGYASSTDTVNQALLTLGGDTVRNSFMSFTGQVSATAANVWSVGLNQSDGSFRIASSTGLAANNYFTIGQGGNVGIGTTSPASTLDVWGGLRVGTSSTPVLLADPADSSLRFGNLTNGLLQTDGTGIVSAVATSSLGLGTVTSVDMSVPTGLAISGNPITTSGTLALTYDTGYAAVLTASTTDWNTFYQTPSSRITAGDALEWSSNTLNVNDVTAAMLASSDFGDFSCDGSTCTFDTSTVASSTLAASNWQNGYILQASTTAPGGFDWVATTSLGFSSQTLTVGSDNQIPFSNAGGTDLEYSADFTFDGSLLTLTGDFYPGTDDTYDLGSTTARWQDLFLGPDTLHIGTSLTDEGTISYDTTGNIFNFGTDSTTNGDIAFFTDDLYLDKSSGYVGVGTTTPNTKLTVNGAISLASTTPAATSSALYNQAGSLYWGGSHVGVGVESTEPIVILTTGQSNMSNQYGSYSWTSPSNIYRWNNATNSASTGTAFNKQPTVISNFDLADVFAAAVGRDHPNRPVYLVNVSQGSLSSANWSTSTAGVDMYSAVRTNISAALADIGETEVDYILWWQGESDQITPEGYYYDQLDTIFSDYRKETWMSTSTTQIFFGLESERGGPTVGFDKITSQIKEFVSRGGSNRFFVDPNDHAFDSTLDLLHLTPESRYRVGIKAWRDFLGGTERGGIQLAAVGRTSIPGYAFESATTTGMFYATTSGSLGFIVDGSEKLLLTTSGDLTLTDTSGSFAIGDNKVLHASSSNFATLVGIGAGSLLNSSGLLNTAVGYQALGLATSSLGNTAIGAQALNINDSGSFNTAIGTQASQLNTSGLFNSSLGYTALQNNTSGSGNLALGFAALSKSETTDYNTAVGTNAGYGIADGDENSVIDTQMTFLGSFASRDSSIASTSALSNSIAIGYNAKVDASNQVVLGNDSITETLLRGNVGIGTSSPASLLDVWGDFRVGTSSRPALFVDTGLGQVLIGTSTKLTDQDGISQPALSVRGTTGAGTPDAVLVIHQESIGQFEAPRLQFDRTTFAADMMQGDVYFPYSAAIQGWRDVGDSLAGHLRFLTSAPGGAGQLERLRITSSGLVEIGTSTASSSKLSIQTHGTTDILNLFETGGAEVFTVLESGNVGIGTSSPASRLDVWGDLRVGTSSTPLLFADAANSYVGIGTESPGAMLDVQGTVVIPRGVSFSTLHLGATTQLVGMSSGNDRIFGALNSNTNSRVRIRNGGELHFEANNDDILFENNALNSENARLTGAGDFGIGTSSPASKLDVWGDFRVGTSGTPAFFVDTSGNNVGIGTTSPIAEAKLTVAGHVFPDADDTYDLGSSTYRWRDLYLGPASLHIGTSTNEVSIGYSTTSDTMSFGGVQSTGLGLSNILIDTADGSVWYSISSAKYKDDIEVLEDDFRQILQIDPVEYTDIGSGIRDIGFIAEHYDALGLTNLVQYTREGEVNGLKYDRVPMYLLPILKDHDAAMRALLGTTTIENLEQDGQMFLSQSSLWERLGELARSFVDGVLTIAGLKTDELCVGDVCVTEDEFRAMVESAGQEAAANTSGGSTGSTGGTDSDDASTSGASDTSSGDDSGSNDGNDLEETTDTATSSDEVTDETSTTTPTDATADEGADEEADTSAADGGDNEPEAEPTDETEETTTSTETADEPEVEDASSEDTSVTEGSDESEETLEEPEPEPEDTEESTA